MMRKFFHLAKIFKTACSAIFEVTVFTLHQQFLHFHLALFYFRISVNSIFNFDAEYFHAKKIHLKAFNLKYYLDEKHLL